MDREKGERPGREEGGQKRKQHVHVGATCTA